MRWTDAYLSKVRTAEEALQVIKSGDRVYVHQGCAQPEALLAAMLQRAPELRNVELVHCATMGAADYARPQYEGHFRHTALFMGANVREAVQQGRADYVPIFLHEIERLFTSGAMPLDAALVQVAPPDDYGYLSLGVSVDITLTAAQYARHLIVEVNDQMPRSLGDSFLHVSKVETIVETSHALPEYKNPPPSDVQRTIARHAANIIPDGATIQAGIGGIPGAILEALRDHKHLGVHSEMVPDGVMDLVQAGVVTNERKTLHPHKVITGFALGTKPLFDFLHDNPIFEFHPTAYTNDPFIIAQNDRMVAINSAVELDLTGQVCSDSIGRLPFSGVGGQVDFIRGAARSKGGLPIIALPSTAKDDTISRIVATLKPGAGIVTSRADAHYVITEFGVAYLHGKTLRQRAEALIQIAHPKFRSELMDAAREFGYWEKQPAALGS
jgi:acyl-CoA hydrolase